MEYEKTILNLMERVATLEEKVAALEGRTPSAEKAKEEKKPRGYYTDIVKNYIKGEITNARKQGKPEITLVSGAIQHAVGLKNRMPLVCNAMRDCMDETAEIVHETPSGQSSTLEIRWKIR